MQNQKENLINIIHRCNCKETKAKWINQLAHETNIECSESECDSCLIATDCISTLGGE